MKQQYQSAYRKLYADRAFREQLIHTLENHEAPRRARPRWLVPAALAACMIVLFGLGVPTLQRVLQPIETVSSVPVANPNGSAVLGSDGLYRDSQITNILFLCTDDAGEGYNTVMLGSLDRRRGAFKLSSFLPELEVETAEGETRLLSVLFEQEGENAVSLIEQNFGLAVDGYVRMGADVVATMIDAMGGVKVDLSQQEAMSFALSSARDISLPGFDAGEYTLSGAQALYFSRIRMNDDFANEGYSRMQRQQKIAGAIWERRKESTDSAEALLQTLQNSAQTNLDLSSVMESAAGLDVFLGNFVAPPDAQTDKIDGVVPGADLETLAKELVAFIYEDALQQTGVVLGEDGLYRDEQVSNVLLCIGAQGDGTDSVFLISLDQEDKALRLVNFATQLAIQTPASGTQLVWHIGAGAGSGATLRDRLEQNFGVAMDGYVRISYEQAIEAIDTIGGVPLTLSIEDAERISEKTGKLDVLGSPYDCRLTGEQAMSYIHQWDKSTTERDLYGMMRHETVLSALLEQMRQADTEKLCRELAKLMETDLSEEKLAALLEALPLSKKGTLETDVCRVPWDFTSVEEDKSFLSADLEVCARGIAEFLFDDLPEDTRWADVSEAETLAVGNLGANLANGGIAVDSGDGSIYYVNFGDNSRIYRWDEEHGTQTALTDVQCLYLNVLNGDLYYVNMVDGGIYCIPAKWNITVPISISDQPHSDLIVTDQYLYYTRGGEIFQRETRAVTDGSDVGRETQLPRVEGELLGIQWGDGRLYYFIRTEETGPRGERLIAMYHDGDTPDCTFSNGVEGDRPYLLDGSTLYYCDDFSIRRIANGKDTQILGTSQLVKAQQRIPPEDASINDANIGTDVDALYVSGNALYFTVGCQLYRADMEVLNGDKDGTAVSIMPGAGSVHNLCMAGDYLYFTSDYTQYTMNRTWRIKADGGEAAEKVFLTDAQRTTYQDRQKQANNGHEAWRILPKDVAEDYLRTKLYLPLTGAKVTLLEDRDNTTVTYRKDQTDLTLYLFQPVTQGASGIWEVAYYIDTTEGKTYQASVKNG